MPCSPEKRAANLANSRKSCGPRTQAGKERSRCNSLKHGLTGAGIAIPDEDRAEVEARFESFGRDLRPRNDVARFLAWQAAMLSVRIERSARQEAASLTQEMIRADEFEAEDRADELADLVDLLDDDPAAAVRKLKRSPEGVDWLLLAFDELKAFWLDPKAPVDLRLLFDRADRLSGRVPSPLKLMELNRLADAKQASTEQRREYFQAYMVIRIESEQNHLRDIRDGFDLEAIAQSRSGASTRAIFDPSHQATLARRYEATATRDFFKSLQLIEKINRQEDEAEAVAPNPSEIEDCAELASSCKAEPTPPEDLPEVDPGPSRFADFLPKATPEAPVSPPDRLPDPRDVANPPHDPTVRE